MATVIIEEQDRYHTIYVDVEKFTGHKPYLGGFRHRKTQQLFHHASAQVCAPVLCLSIAQSRTSD